MVRASAEAGEIKGGGGLIEAGGNHCMVEDCSEVNSDFGPQVKMEYICLASTNPDNVGRKRSEFLDVTGKNQWKWWEFAVAVGLATQAEYEDFKKNGGEREFDETHAIGRQFCCEHREESWTVKSGQNAGQKKSDFQYGHRIWAVDDKRAEAIPKEPTAYGSFMAAKQRALAARGQQLTQSGGMTANGTGAAANGGRQNGGHANGGRQPQQQQAAGSGVLGGWSDDEASQF